MKTIINYLLACVFVVSCVNNQSPKNETSSESLIVEDSLNMGGPVFTDDNVPKELSEDEYFLMHQPKSRRLVFIPKKSFETMLTETDIFLLDSVKQKTYKYRASVNDQLHNVFPGRTEDEIYVFSIGGSGRFCCLVRLQLTEERKTEKHILVTGGAYKAKRTNRGFLVSYFMTEFESNDGKAESWDEEYDFDGNLIATYEK